MEDIWKQLEIWLSNNKAFAILNDLNLPMQPEESDQILSLFPDIPKDFLDSYNLHNGEGGRFSFIYESRLLPIKLIVQKIEDMKEIFSTDNNEEIEAVGDVKSDNWNEKWMPISSDGSGGLFCLDFDSPDTGILGQVIFWASDPPYVEVTAPSYRAWLEKFAFDLEAGKYKWGAGNEEWSQVTDET
jgi:cell wall assembly regulator SMI1